ncbi:protein of unknown function DUF1292 [Ammonifex degensii KC4]|uniref:UPF0473 protein Adeg_1437 n=2 Tax=Ammonifex degensii TaxID=42838 RepID=C9R8A8_AMMDK|nr:protein of unknown function DUF1292 [Ammonifex degensii KC4]
MKGDRKMAEELEVITLVDENGEEQDFEVLDILEVEGSTYAVLLPLGQDEESGDILILKFSQDEEGNEILVDLEDEEWEKVADIWEELRFKENNH